MRKKIVVTLLALAMAAGSVPADCFISEAAEPSVMQELYVSPNGHPDASGTKADPLDGMESARKKVQTMNDNMSGDIIVYFEGGEYFVKEKSAFSAKDSGTNGHKVVYKAVPGETPIFTSGVEISGWKDAGDAQRTGLMVADAKDITDTRQVYVDGEMAVRARGNVEGNITRYGDKKVYTTYNGDHDAYSGYKVDNLNILDWKNPETLEFVYDISWAHRIVPVDSVEKMSDSEIFIRMEEDSFRTSQIAGGVQANLPSYIENAYELLDEPGEWYFDEEEKKIYYMPKKGQNMSETEVIVPTTEQFFTVEGEVNDKVHDISFEGLNFEYNTWLYPSTHGWPEQQANFAHDPKETYNMHAYSMIPQASIEVKMAERISITGCNFQNLGSAAINILQGTVENVVQQCVFKDISAGGILVGGVNIDDAHPYTGEGMTIENHTHDDRLIVKDNTITNNYFNGIGTEYKGSIGITVGYTDHTVITHNTVRDVAYSGISVGWGWGYWDQGGRFGDDETPADYPVFPVGDAAVSRNNVIEYNDVSLCMMKLHDGAGIYTLGDMPNSSIRYNLIHDNVGWPGGIYLDQGSGGMTVEENITYNVQVPLNHNVREYTWGYKNDHPVIKDNNYFNISPDMDGYPTELAAQTGVQDEYSCIIPKELNSMTAPEFPETGDRVLLEGNFGKETGKIILQGKDGEIVVDKASGNIISWTEEQILFRIPGGVVTGRVYVKCADGTDTNRSDILTIGNFKETLFEDDFDSYETGNFKEQDQAAKNYNEISDRASIEEKEDGSKVLKLSSNWADTIISKNANWSDVMLTLDFYFETKPESFGGIYVVPRYQDSQNKNIAEFLPSYGDGVLFQQYVGGNLSVPGSARYQYKDKTWYSTKIAMVGNEMKVKVWEKDSEEPSLWTGTAEFSGIKEGGLSLYYMDFQESAAQFDNLKVLKYEEGATEEYQDDKTAPSLAAIVTGNQEEDGSYNSEVSIALEASDAESEVAEIEYSISGEEYAQYKKPLKIQESGEYRVSYRAIDKAGNITDTEEVQIKIAIDQASTVIFEDNFDSYETGTFADLSKGYQLTHPDAFEIEEGSDGNKQLKIKGVNGQAVRLIKPDTWDNSVMTFDFKYENPLTSYGGVYVSNYFQSFGPDNMYHYPIIPEWGGIFLQSFVNGNVQEVGKIENDKFRVTNGEWYSVEVQTSTNYMAFKIWKTGEEKPTDWMAESEVSGLTGGGGLELSFTDLAGDNSVLFDNVEVKAFGYGGNDQTEVKFISNPKDSDIRVFDENGQDVKTDKESVYTLASGNYTYQASKEEYQEMLGGFGVLGESHKTVYLDLTKKYKKADRTKLDALIQEAMKIQNLEIYTEDSVKEFETALENAIKLPDTATQEEVDKVADALRNAMDGLTIKEENNPPTSEDGKPSGKPDGEPSGKPSGDDTSGKGDESSQAAVETGDHTRWLWLSLLVLVSVGVFSQRFHGRKEK